MEDHAGMTGFIRTCTNTALVVASLIVGLMMGEIGLRLVGFTNPGDFKAPPRGYAPRFYYAPDPVNGHDIRENFSSDLFLMPDYIRSHGAPFTVSSNSLGCRDRAFDPRDGYVLLLGDSVTEGYVALEQTWGTTLENLIAVRVLKCGVSGYGTLHEQHKLDTVTTRAGRPAFVIIGHVWNDLVDDYLYPGRTVIDGYMLNKTVLDRAMQGHRMIRSEETLQAKLKMYLEPHFGPIRRANDLLADYSILYDRMGNSKTLQQMASWFGFTPAPQRRSELEAFQSVAEFPWLEQAWEEHLENLKRLKLTVEALGATTLLVIFPDVRQLYASLRPQQDNFQWEHPNQRLTEFFHREQIAFVDLLPEFTRYVNCVGRSTPNTLDDLYWTHDDHPNIKGNRLAGLLISRHVLEQSLIQVDDKSRRLSDIDQLLRAEDRCSSKVS